MTTTTKHRGRNVNLTELSELRGVAVNTILGAVKRGAPVLRRGRGGGKGEGSWLFNSASWIEWEIDEAVGRVTGNPPTARQSRELYWAARAKREQLEVKSLEGQLVDVAEVEAMWSRLTSNFRTRLLALPVKMAGRLIGLAEATVIRDRLEDEVHRALAELSASTASIAKGEAAASDGDSHPGG